MARVVQPCTARRLPTSGEFVFGAEQTRCDYVTRHATSEIEM